MRQVLIRNVNEDVLRTLKDRASSQGKSLEQLLRDILCDAAEPNAARRLALADRIRDLTPPGAQSDSTRLVRRDRQR